MANLKDRVTRWLAPRPPVSAPPPRFPRARTLPDWAAIGDYYDLAKAISAARPMTADAFLSGPFTRYLEICSTDEHPRGRARAMEFALGAFRTQCKEMAARGEPVEAFEAQAWALAHRYLDAAPNGDYMIEVLEGRATHNYRAPARD
jgi:hypothetical protein